MFGEFKKFAFKGNLLDLAIGFILGVAFSAVVNSLVEDIFMSVIGAIVSDQSLAALTVNVGGAEVRYGSFLTVLINFLLIAWILFLVVRSANRMRPKTGGARRGQYQRVPVLCQSDPTQGHPLPESHV